MTVFAEQDKSLVTSLDYCFTVVQICDVVTTLFDLEKVFFLA